MAATDAEVQQQPCPSCATFVDTTDQEPLAKITCPNCGANFKVVRQFGSFVVTETLGVGGMGTVYRACDTRLDRMVALKLLRKDLGSDKDWTAELQHEARITAAITHPHVVKVFSFGSDHGQFYLVMELVDGGSLDDRIEEQKKLPEERVVEIGTQVARGLHAAHVAGLIHRDVKPANILFSDEQTAKVADFGLAVLNEQRSEETGEIWGTPYYVAPERLNNEPEDFRSDIYSLGATLFHALAGRPTFEGDTTSATELRELKAKPPDLRAIVPEASEETERVITRMLQPDPAQRHGSYKEVVAELQRAHRAVVQRAAGRMGALLRLIGNVAIGVLCISALYFGAVYGWRYLHSAAPSEPLPIPEPTPQPTPDEELPIYTAWKNSPRLADPAAELARIRDTLAKLKSSSGYARELRQTESRIAAQIAQQERAAGEARKQEEQRAFEAEKPAWDAAVAAYRKYVASYQFLPALTAISAPKLTHPGLAAEQERQKRKAQWLIDWQAKLIADLNRSGYAGQVQVRGANYSLGAANLARIVLKLPFGTSEAKWTDFAPQTLLTVSRSFIKENAPDAADRQWLCAVFAAETGQTEAARELATAAAKAKSEYAPSELLPP